MTHRLHPSESFLEFGNEELDRSLIDRFEHQVHKYPQKVAIVTKKHTLTYEELNRRANIIALAVLNQDAESQVPVALLLGNDAPMIEAILGVLKAGRIYVPLDASLPASRLGYILQDSLSRFVLTDTDHAELADSLVPENVSVINIDSLDWQAEAANPGIDIPPDSLTWIIYTSGSTGKPKGVVQTHRNVLQFVRNYTNGLFLSSFDRLALLFSFGVNGAAHEMFCGLLNGASLHPLDIKKEGLTGLADWLTDQQVTTYASVPTVFRHFCEALTGKEYFPTLRFIKLIGEPVLKKDVDLYRTHFSSHSILINRLGSTETGTIRWHFIDGATQIEGNSVPVGYPVPDNEVVLLDEQRNKVAPGEVGEIAVKSRYLSPGYWRKPEATQKAFLTTAEPGGERIYLTGDMGRTLSDGCLLHMGRKDFQVKIRGYRIETAEIEMALLGVSGAKEAIVMDRKTPQGESRLVAYLLVRDQPAPTVGNLRRALLDRLPEYMIPSVFLVLPSFPLAPNGKVNRGALPLPDTSRPDLENTFIAPSSPTEEAIAQIWSEILSVNPVGIHDNFFELGGHSMAAAQIVSRIARELNVELTINVLFEEPTVAAMARRLDSDEVRDLVALSIQPIPRSGELPLSLAQERLWFLDQLMPNSAAYNVVSAVRLKGPLRVEILQKTIEIMVTRHEALRTSFVERAGRAIQVIAERVTIDVRIVDLSHLPQHQLEAEAGNFAKAMAQQPFDLTDAPLFRAKLLRFDRDDHVLVTAAHHIVTDGWSMNVFFRDLGIAYRALSHGEPLSLPALPIQYADFAVWQREWLSGERIEKQLAYWMHKLGGDLPVFELPSVKPRPAVKTYRGTKASAVLSQTTADGLKVLSRREKVTLFVPLLAAFVALLHRHTGQDDVLIGTDVANRNRVETENLIGFFVGLLPIRVNLSGEPTSRELLQRVWDTMRQAFAHPDVPFDKLVAKLNPKRDTSRNPLVQILFNLQNGPEYTRAFSPDFNASAFEVNSEIARFDLVLFVKEANQQIITTWNYNTDLFDEATMQSMMRQYEEVLNLVVTRPFDRISDFSIGEIGKQEPKVVRASATKITDLKRARRKAVDLSRMTLVTTGYLQPGSMLPLVIQPDANDIDLTSWAQGNVEFIEAQLFTHGAILFRGCGLSSITDFENFASAICPQLFVEYGDLPREQASSKVYHSTPYPADQPILFHNESSHMHQWPMKQWFFCMETAQSGGETPIVDCREVYRQIGPEVSKRFEREGILYVRNFTPALDVTWQDFFKTKDRSVVEFYCRNAGIDVEWKNNDHLRIRHISPAVMKHPKTGEMVWFNQIQHWHTACLGSDMRESMASLFGEDRPATQLLLR